jgi:hypothetical protein
MKTSLPLFAALVSAKPDERKVPPRTPDQRLGTLHRFAQTWVSSDWNSLNRPTRAVTAVGAWDRVRDAMLAAWEKKRKDGSGLRTCGFFDPNVEHGGPNPNGPRTRRAALWMEEEYRRIAREVDEFGLTDPFGRLQNQSNNILVHLVSNCV